MHVVRPGHWAKHAPQCCSLESRLAHVFPHNVVFAGQIQVPRKQVAPGGQPGLQVGGSPGRTHEASQASLSRAHCRMQAAFPEPLVPAHSSAQLTLHPATQSTSSQSARASYPVTIEPTAKTTKTPTCTTHPRHLSRIRRIVSLIASLLSVNPRTPIYLKNYRASTKINVSLRQLLTSGV